MPAPNSISADKLARLTGTPSAPILIDLREGAASTIPGARWRDPKTAADWGKALGGAAAVAFDQDGGASAAAAAAVLRTAGIDAETLYGGFASWKAAALPIVRLDHLPPAKDDGRTWWITRARPKVDRIACPWLIRRFVDPDARILFVPPADVLSVAAELGAEPFDISADGVFWSHRGERCTFDTMIEAFGLDGFPPLAQLAAIVRGADTDQLATAPEASGLLAVSLGLSRLYANDHEQLDAGMLIYDALYRWCRDAQGETHDWASHRPAGVKVEA